MNFQQWRAVQEAARLDCNLTRVAEVMHTSQSGVSRQIRELENELGVVLFHRIGKRLTGMTPAGDAILPMIDRILVEHENIKRARDRLFAQDVGTLTIAATHTQARYALPDAVRDFAKGHPNVTLTLLQGLPEQVAELLVTGKADIGIATEALDHYPQLVALPCYRWTHAVLVPKDNPLANLTRPIELDDLDDQPLVTYERGFTGRARIDAAFASRGWSPRIAIAAMDADVIKTYVQLGMGIGIVASMAYDPDRDREMVALDAGHLFGMNVTRLAVHANAWLAKYAYAFIESFAPTLDAASVKSQLASASAQVIAGTKAPPRSRRPSAPIRVPDVSAPVSKSGRVTPVKGLHSVPPARTPLGEIEDHVKRWIGEHADV